MTTSIKNRFGTALNGLYLICVALFALALAYKHVQLAFNEYPVEYNETGILVTTATILEGGNPFSRESQPARISVYPVLFSVIVAPLAEVFGNTLELHRVVGGLFILASCVLVYCLSRRSKVPPAESFAAAVLYYAALLYYSTPVASPNGLGLFLFLLAIAVPWIYQFSARSLLVSIVLGILAFYTKQYFIAALGYIALYLFLAQSKRRALYFGSAAAAIFLVTAVLVAYTYPYYWQNTYFVPLRGSSISTSYEHVIVQSEEFLRIYYPIIIILVAALVYHWRLRSTRRAGLAQHSMDGPSINLFDLNKPLLARKPHYIGVCLACSVAIVALILGPNKGNHLTYFFQLITPFLVIFTLILSSDIQRGRWPFRVLIVWALGTSYSILPTNYSVNDEGWLTVKRKLAGAQDVFSSTLALHDLVERNLPIHNSGATVYFIFGHTDFPLLGKKESGESHAEIWERHVRLVQRKITNQEFDLLVLDNWQRLPQSLTENGVDTNTLLSQYYKKTRPPVKLSLASHPNGGKYTLHFWEPIRPNSNAKEGIGN